MFHSIPGEALEIADAPWSRLYDEEGYPRVTPAAAGEPVTNTCAQSSITDMTRRDEVTVQALHDVQLTLPERPHWLSHAEWPFPTRRVAIDGCGVAVTDVGQGPTLLFIHTGMWSFVWRDVMMRLRRELRCVCVDAPANGLSEAPQGPVTLERSARVVRAVLEELDLQSVTLVCHDLGGITGFAGASRTPERIAAIVAANTFAWKPHSAAFRAALRFFGSSLIQEVDARAGLIPRIASSRHGVGRHFSPAGRRMLRGSFDRTHVRAFHRYIRDALQCDGLYAEISRAIAGPFARLPLMTIFGARNDPFGFQAQWKARFPQAVQNIVEGGGHFPMCEAPDRFAAWIRSFLSTPTPVPMTTLRRIHGSHSTPTSV